MERKLGCMLLAAGQGVRMRSKKAKVLHELGGIPFVVRSLRALAALEPDHLVVVVGYQGEEVQKTVLAMVKDERLIFAHQEQRLGTGHAVMCGLQKLPADFKGELLIAYGDMPALRAETLRDFISAHRAARCKLSLVTIELNTPTAYGRVIRNKDGEVEAILEAEEATPEELKISELNAGVYLVELTLLAQLLERIKRNSTRGEYYLTDIVKLARLEGVKVFAWRAPNAHEFIGVNSRQELAYLEAELRQSINQRLMEQGVTLIDPATTYIGEEVEIGIDSTIGPNVQIFGRSRIGERVRIEGCALLRDVTIGDDCLIKLGVRAEQCYIGPGCEIGPFANLRPGTELEGANRIGNFVETKQARIGHGSKASHLSYLGDVIIGAGTNIGCGVITVNFDGYEKHVTQIGSRCMIGCDSQLIAPVKIGDDAYIASGTTVRHDVTDGALAFCEHRQQEKPGWVTKWRQRHELATGHES